MLNPFKKADEKLNKKGKSEAEMLHDAQIQKELIRKRDIAKNSLYPMLLKSSKNIEDAKIFCQSTAIAIKQAFNNRMATTLVSDLKLMDMIDKKNLEYERYKEVLDIFEMENMVPALEVLEGMAQAIESFQREEALGRKLESLKPTFL